MASADFCHLIPTPLDAGSLWQDNKPPRVMRVTFPLIPAAYTSTVSVQVSGFRDICLFTHCDRLLCNSCSSGQCFAYSFLQIPPHNGHPCRSANRSPCRANSGLSPPSHPTATMRIGTAPVKALRAMPGAQTLSRVRLSPHPSHRTVHTDLVYGSCKHLLLHLHISNTDTYWNRRHINKLQIFMKPSIWHRVACQGASRIMPAFHFDHLKRWLVT